MTRQLSAEELAALSPDERAHRERMAHQIATSERGIHDIARQNVVIDLDGRMWVRGREDAPSPQEVAAALDKHPEVSLILDAIAVSKGRKAAHAGQRR